MSNTTLLIGHRGAMGHETENTMASVEKALELAVDMIEIDVFKIKSGEIIVFHDDTVERLTDGVGKIEDYTLENLKKLTLAGNHKIPLLTDVLNLIDGKVPVNIELKGKNTAAAVNSIINYFIDKKKWKLSNFLISSFNWDELVKARTLNSEISIAVLTEENPVEAISIATTLKAKAINPNYELLTFKNATKIKEAGFKIYTWTVNTSEEFKQMEAIGVDGIFTNYPKIIEKC